MADEFGKVYEQMVANSAPQAVELLNKRKYHRAFTMSDAEIMVILIQFHSSVYRCMKHFYLEIAAFCYFPKKPAITVIKSFDNQPSLFE
ncbi:MAG: hypothetical protein IJS20_10800 [Bacteroidales bacterium]|nr:hypothetical protein [Bacteroidales bacterium]